MSIDELKKDIKKIFDCRGRSNSNIDGILKSIRVRLNIHIRNNIPPFTVGTSETPVSDVFLNKYTECLKIILSDYYYLHFTEPVLHSLNYEKEFYIDVEAKEPIVSITLKRG